MLSNSIVAPTESEVRRLFARQQAAAPALSRTTARERLAKLQHLEDYLRDRTNQDQLVAALQADFGKPETETLTSELWIVLTQLGHIRRHLRAWMRPQRVGQPITLLGTTSYIHHESKGMALVLSPWNYPFNLSMVPVIYAIAAGCTVVLKPSEFTPRTSAYMREMLTACFPADEVTLVEGEADVAQLLTSMPFHHIYFTGSPQVGKRVMAAASQHLASVTLELGGKSPAIVDTTVDLQKSAAQTVWAKHFNAGQTCIAPDYLLVHESIAADYATAYGQAIDRFYGRGNGRTDYARIIHDRHFEHLQDMLQDALSKGATLAHGGQLDAEQHYFAPTLLTGVTQDMLVMQEEIFGPIMPLVTYSDTADAIRIVNSYPKPLTLYLQSHDQHFIRSLVQATSAGGTVINDYLLGFTNPHLPFGGVNNSGIGKSLGHRGFLEFINERSIVHRRWFALDFVYPPYTKQGLQAVRALVRWL